MIQRFRMCLACAALVALSAQTQAQELPVPCVNCAGGFVSSGAANYITSGNSGIVNQTSERAILNWQSFNIGPDGSVVFQQPSATSAALNRIFQDDPVRILGTLTANGQVYLINPNGIVFGQGAQVNVRGLVASTLDVSDDVFLNLGITGAIRAGESVNSALPAFAGDSDAGIHVANGARIKVGERVILIGAEVKNEGTIEAPDGQAILAGSHDTVYLAEDAEFRGLLIEVGTGGEVENLGSILTERGNTTLVGLAVNQSGRISASTSVNVNGSIRLLARDGAIAVTQNDGSRDPEAQRTGTLVFGSGSTTEIQLSNDGATAVDGQPQQQSRLEAMGRTVHVQSDARVLVPGGSVQLTATSTPQQPLLGSDREARVFLDEGSLIDVSGDTSAVIAMERNQGTIKLFGNELADAPVQRDGPLARQPITVDLRRGTPLTDIRPLLDQVQRTVGERLSAGGTVSLRAEGDVVVDTNATIDISGGQVEYLPGYLSPTKLVTNGRTIDISEADPLLQYDGIVNTFTRTDSKWGVTESWVVRGGQFEAGYVEGKDAGRLLVETRAGAVALAGNVRGDTVAGFWQREAPSSLVAGLARPYTELPLGGALEIAAGSNDVRFESRTIPQVYAFETVLPRGLTTSIPLEMFDSGGINRFDVATAGRVEVPEDVRIELDPGGSFSATGSTVRVAGDIRVQSGEVELNATSTATEPAVMEIAATADIDVSGGWVNETALANGGEPTRELMFLDGGRIDLASQGDLTLARGSRLNVSAGAALLADEDLRYGGAGSVSLASVLADENFEAPTLTLDGELSGFGFTQGGRLEIRAGGFQVGQGAPVFGQEQIELAAGHLALAPEFFQQGGFADFSLVADRGDIEIAPDTQLLLRPQNLRLQHSMFRQRTGVAIETFSERLVLLDHERGTSSFSASIEREARIDSANASIRIGTGSRVETETGGSISLSADTNVVVDGALIAKAGSIDLSLTNPNDANEEGYIADQAIRLESRALLDVSGTSRLFIDAEGQRFGDVLDGGTIALHADRGYVFGASESHFDLSGAAETLSLPSDAGGLAPTTVFSSAGSLEVRVAEGGSLAGSIDAHGGGGSASDGSLRVTIDGNTRDPNHSVLLQNVPQFPVARREIVVGVSEAVIGPGGTLPPDQNGRYFLSTEVLDDAGFDAIDLIASPFARSQAEGNNALPSAVRFDENVTLHADRRITIDAALVESAGGTTVLDAPHIALGQTDSGRGTQPAVSQPGEARLVVNAQHLDLNGSLTLSGFGGNDGPAVVLNSSGDIRMNGVRLNAGPTHFSGSLETTADILLRASRIYPSTLTEYAILATGDEGKIVVERVGDATTPLSAAGRLTLSAATIEQGGVLLAPFGRIELHATDSLVLNPGSVTSVSAADTTIPFGVSEFGQDWIYPLVPFLDKNFVLDAAPERRVELQAPEVDIASGALVDLRGGGDLLTYEFVKGPGGSRDILLSDNPEGAFAILPANGLQFGVLDSIESAGAGIEIGDTIHLAGGGGVPAGEYVRLPARYALLPGAFLITPISDTQDISPTTPQVLADNSTPVVAGRLGFAGNDIADTRWSGFAIESAERVRERAEFNVRLASNHFGADARARTADAGSLIIDADRAIRIDGSLAAAAASGGRGALVDVIAEELAVVNVRSTDTQRVELVAAELANFADASVMLGGTRSRDDESVTLDVQAQSVTFESDTTLRAQEVIVAARDAVSIAQGVVISAEGAADETGPEEFTVTGDGAFVRVSTADQAVVDRTGSSGQLGVVNIAEGATLLATRSINVEASRDVRSAGDLIATGGSLSLTASLIALGDTNTDAGLVLSNADLARFQARELQLNSRSTIDVYGAVSAQLDTVRLDAAGLRGLDNAAAGATLAANTIVLENSRGTSVTTSGDGTGQLTLSARQLELGEGSVDISGFAGVQARASEQVIATESGSLRARGNLTIETPRITAESGVDIDVVADGVFATVAMAAPVDQEPTTGLGAKLSMTGASVDHGGRIELASGLVTLNAVDAGGVKLRAGSTLDVSGRSVTFDDLVVGSPGGDVTLTAAMGSVRIEDTATIDISGAPSGGDAGRLTIDAHAGSLAVAAAANLRGAAAADANQGTFIADVNTIEGTFSALNAQLNAGGFTRRRDLTLGEGDLVIDAADSLVAQQVNLSADDGSIIVDGYINAIAASGGEVRLSAMNDVRVGASGRIDARATSKGEEGGRVELSTQAGMIQLAAASGAIDVAGTDENGTGADTGAVHLRAPRVGTTGVGVSALAANTIAGAEHVDIEAVQVYESATFDSTLMNAIAADTDAYMASSSTIKDALGVGADTRYRLIAGEEVRSTGDLTLLGTVDFAQRRYDDTAGVLTLRAAGDLRLNGELSDGLVEQEFVIDFQSAFRDVVQTGESWGYRLVGGARLDGADALGIVEGLGDVIVGDAAIVRTGTGSIDVAAGSDLVFSSGFGSIYTVGENRGTGTLDADAVEATLSGDFVENGGDVRINVGRDLRGVTDQFMPDYLPRAAGSNFAWRSDESFPFSSAVDSSKFRQGIGALGGGDIVVETGGDLDSLTIAIPTNVQAGALDGSDPRIAGGGDLSVSAGGAINGGNFLLGRGSGVLIAHESIGGNGSSLAPTLQLGDATMSLSARSDVEIGTVFNPTVAQGDPSQGRLDILLSPKDTFAFSYTDRSAISAQSWSGDVALGAALDAQSIALLAPDGRQVTAPGLLGLYPGNLSAQSLRGNVRVSGKIYLFPAENGHLELLAGQSIGSAAQSPELIQSDGDVSLLPSLITPSDFVNGTELRLVLEGHAKAPVHLADATPARIVAQTGDIGDNEDGILRLILSEQARLFAGRDILNLNLTAQHNNAEDVTVIHAGRDITYPATRGAAGFFDDKSQLGVKVDGPGRLDLIAGSDVTLGTSSGISTGGNISNPALPADGADITIFAGLKGSLPVENFIGKYLAEGSEYLEPLTEFVTRFTTDASRTPIDRFRDLNTAQQREFIVRVFFNELRESGIAAVDDGDFSRGYAAVDTLFPEEKYEGDLSSFLSRISTLDGGDINLLVPGGLVNAGVASSGRFNRPADLLGIVAQRDGDVNGFVKGDFLVNASRVFALDGGDVLLWSSEADIDAGRGAKSALAIPPPKVGFDSQGNTVVEFPPAVAGSGIRTAVSTPGRKPGDVYLFAPSGVVDAGDAGIESAGNITVVATQVIGADNISAAGTSVGVPVDTGGLGASLAGVSAASSSATNSATSGEDTQSRATEQAPLAETALSWLEVFVVGLGEDTCKQDDLGCLKRQKVD